MSQMSTILKLDICDNQTSHKTRSQKGPVKSLVPTYPTRKTTHCFWQKPPYAKTPIYRPNFAHSTNARKERGRTTTRRITLLTTSATSTITPPITYVIKSSKFKRQIHCLTNRTQYGSPRKKNNFWNDGRGHPTKSNFRGEIEGQMQKKQKNVPSRVPYKKHNSLTIIQSVSYLLKLCARRDSNPYRWYRKPKFYPLNYGRKKLKCLRYNYGRILSESGCKYTDLY